MASLGKAAFKGGSGKAYRFRVFALGTKFRKLSGVYVIASRTHRQDGGYRHLALYVGHTEDFSQPFDEHRKAAQFMQQGANCICLQKDVSEDSRLAKEQDLVAGLHPTCNDCD
jgi:hypothetical protein